MKTTMDRAGRVVVPKALREAIGLRPGMEIELHVSDGRIKIEPVSLEVRLERKGGLLVAVSTRAVPPLSTSVVNRTLHGLRAARPRRRR